MKNFQLFFVLLTSLSYFGNHAFGATWEKAKSIAAGDVVALVCESKSMELSGISTTSTKYGIGVAYETTPAGAYALTVEAGSTSGTYSFKCPNGQYLYWTSGNSLATNATKSANTSWKVTFSGETLTIVNAKDNTRTLGWNASSPRFACYTTNQTAVQLYKKVESTGGETPDPTTYTIKWHTAKGVTTDVTLNEGATITKPATDPTMTGYTFMGWTASCDVASDGSDFSALIDFGTADSDKDFYAVFAVATTTGGESTTTEVTDVLNRATTGATGTSYGDWTGKTATSSAVYAGNSAGGNSSIQLRSSNSTSGIVTTASGGKATKISVVWNSNTSSGRTIDIYGKNSAYTQATDLYNSTNQGTKLGSIKCGTSTELTISGDYEYIGIRSNSGALYLTSVSITWGSEEPSGGTTTYSDYITTCSNTLQPSLSSLQISGNLTKNTYEEGEELDFSGLIVQANYENGDPKDVTNEVEWSYTPNPLTEGTTSVDVTATYGDKTATKTINDLTVNEHIITPGKYCIIPNNAFWGTSYTGTDAASAITLSGKQNDITILHAKNSSNNLYVNDSQTRAYEGHTMKISVPSGYVITSIEFTKGTSWEGNLSADCGTMVDNINWNGTNQDVTITFNDGKCFITNICVTYIKDVKYALIITEPTEGGTLIVKDGTTTLTSGAQIYDGTILTVTTTPAEGYEEGIVVIKNENGDDITTDIYADGTLTMPAHPITISATFERKPCSLLSTPTISATTTTTYNTATLTWNTVENAEKYSVQIGTADAVETTETSYEVTGLNAETTYTYQVQAIAEAGQDTYCDSELAEGSFTTSQAPIATLILSENGEIHDLDGEHRLYEIVTLPNTAATCTKTFVGWSADANCTTAPEYAPGASYTLSELAQTLYAVYATANGAETKYIKLTTTPSPSFAGTYLIVNEEKQVAFNGGLTTLDTEGNTISVEITNDTIESNDAIENATFLIIKRQNENNYLIKSKSEKYIGRTENDNGLDESTEKEYTNTISIDADGNANIIGSGGAYLRYNATSNQKRFRYYKSTSYTSQKAIALYKKYSIPLYTNYTTYCGDDITISSGTTQTFNTDQQINTLIIEGGATANLVAGNIEINTIILKGGLNADATDYKMPILYTNGATIDVDHLYLDLAINHNTYYPFAVPFPVSVSDIDYANPTLAAASEYGTHYLIKRYDGAKRAENGVNKDENWVVVETDDTLQPGVGYIISALTGKSETTTTIQIPLTFVPEQNSTLSITAHTGNAAANDPIQKGWNFIAHPYLSKYAGNNINNAPRYVSIPTYNFSAYQQTMLMATTLSPEYPFFVQIGENTEINFTTEGRRQTPASVRADENNQILNLLFKILLADQAQDQTGIILDNNCTPAYEIDADLEKMFGSAFTTSIYTLCQDKRLAFNAMSFENAQSSPIPLGYRAAEAGEYTINLDIIEDASAYEHLYEGIVLYDSTTETKTNLLYADYTFTTEKIQDDTRFSIQFVPKNNTSTNIENIENIHTTQKIIYNNQLYILHNGQIYNPIGQSIR